MFSIPNIIRMTHKIFTFDLPITKRLFGKYEHCGTLTILGTATEDRDDDEPLSYTLDSIMLNGGNILPFIDYLMSNTSYDMEGLHDAIQGHCEWIFANPRIPAIEPKNELPDIFGAMKAFQPNKAS